MQIHPLFRCATLVNMRNYKSPSILEYRSTKLIRMKNSSNPVKTQAVIAARPGVIREALRATLAQFSRLEVLGVADGGLSTLNLVRKYKPALLVIDSGLLQDEILMLLVKAKQEQPEIRCIVVAVTKRQQQNLLAHGADHVILRNEPTERLVESLKDLTES